MSKNKARATLSGRKRAWLPRLTCFGGAIAGALYTLQSAPHMQGVGSMDLLLVALLLSVLAAGIGWLAGWALIWPIPASGPPPAEHGKATPGRARAEGRSPSSGQ